MNLSRSKRILIPGILSLLLVSASGCLSDNTPTQNFVLGRVQVEIKDTDGAAVPLIRVDLTKTDKSIWREVLTTTDGTAEFGAVEGGVIIQNYLVHVILPVQYILAPNETNDKPVTPIENQITVIQVKLAKSSATPPS